MFGLEKIYGGLTGQTQEEGEREKADALRRQDRIWNQLGEAAPDYTEGAPSVQQETGDTYLENPLYFQADSNLWGVGPEQESVDAQYRALHGLEDIYQNGGMTDADRSEAAMRMRRTAQAERGQREALQQQMAARGMGGSGAELAGLLANQQGMTNTNADYEAQLQSEAQRRALQALEGAGNLSTNVRTGSWNENLARGTAQDAIDASNTSILTGIQRDNTQALNDRSNRRGDAFRAGYQDQMDAQQRGFHDATDIAAGRTGQLDKRYAAGQAKEDQGNAIQGAGYSALGGLIGGPTGAQVGSGLGGGSSGNPDDEEH